MLSKEIEYKKNKLKIENNCLIKFLKKYQAASGRKNIKFEKILEKTKNNNLVLNIGAGNDKKQRNLINIDIVLKNNINVFCDCEHLPFKDNVFSAVILKYVIHHIKNPQKCVDEAHRVLKQNSEIITAVPFIEPYHPNPTDYYRYTLPGLELLFQKFEKIESGVIGGPGSALAEFMREFFVAFFQNILLRKIIRFISGWLFMPLKYLDCIFEKRAFSFFAAYGVYFYGRKK